MTPGLTFGEALEALREGHKVARGGWAEDGSYLIFCAATLGSHTLITECEEFEILPTIGLWMGPKRKALLWGWLASPPDILATDWRIIE